MLSKDIRQYIIKPTLTVTNLWSPSAEILVYGTGLIETKYDYLMQIGTPQNGGVGFFQCEPSDYNDIYNWMRVYERALLDKILAACYYSSFPVDPNALASNIKLAVLICRIHYFRIKEDLPTANDAAGMAQYHMKYYNGDGLGKTNVEANTNVFQQIIDNE